MKRTEVNLLLYLIADPTHVGNRPFLQVVGAALSGGVTAVQLRWKTATARDLLEIGGEMKPLAHRHSAAILVNDRPDLALALDAEGAHVGPEDLPTEEARHLLAPPRVLGVSAGSIQEALRAQDAGVDYLGVGPIFPTETKSDAGAPIGLSALSEIAAAVRVPVVGIGGVNEENASSVIEAGAKGIAVVSAILGSPGPELAARSLRLKVQEALGRVRAREAR
jgi:thiamine-phosphate pyrophosphorylase